MVDPTTWKYTHRNVSFWERASNNYSNNPSRPALYMFRFHIARTLNSPYITTSQSTLKFNSGTIIINMRFCYLSVIDGLLAFQFSTKHHELMMLILKCTLPFHRPIDVEQKSSEWRKHRRKTRACTQEFSFQRQSIWSRLLAFVIHYLSGWIRTKIVTYLSQFCAMINHSKVNKFTRGKFLFQLLKGSL